ncbi:hypothetical protein LTR56_026050 [Elasticomyces elasticus]|nr:hypothetical protein LTR56_026050 [Elasticomyces elasticus]KAK3618783.1 hypothetical protein LTR22_026241 [Elasticomyces elasticus]KAK5702443.1 hypothetical protein LTS12_028344 [Elasticomyces elasticus]
MKQAQKVGPARGIHSSSLRLDITLAKPSLLVESTVTQLSHSDLVSPIEMSTVLVTYCSIAGSTASIAERIAGDLRTRVSNVHGIDCMPIDMVAWPNSYRAIVVGSAVHAAAWLPTARRFLADHSEDFYPMPVYTFSVGAPAAMPKWLDHGHAGQLQEKEKLKLGEAISLASEHPMQHELFNGVTSKRGLSYTTAALWTCMGGRFGDFREWDKVDAFANGIAEDLEKREW